MRAISRPRISFLALNALKAPARTDGSWPRITHSTPSMTPMPTTKPEPTVKLERQAASGLISRNAESGSSASEMRSRSGILPRLRKRASVSSPPPAAASA